MSSLCLALCTDYTHVIAIGNNEPNRVLAAFNRYGLGGDGYVDPVAFENVFEIVDGVPSLTFEPMIRVRGSGIEELIHVSQLMYSFVHPLFYFI